MALRGADPSLWYCFPGVIAAYQPIAAPSFSMAFANMAHGGAGRYHADSAVVPTWNITGATFDGATQYLDTGVIPAEGFSHLVQYVGATSSGYICGTSNNYAYFAFQLRPTDGGSPGHALYSTSTYVERSPGLLAGNLGLAGTQPYRNGVNDGAAISYASWSATQSLYLGGNNLVGALNGPGAFTLWAYVIYNRCLSEAEMWLAAQQMAYCYINPAWNVWAPLRRWFLPPPPAPAAATPVLSTIYLNTADIGDTSLFDEASGTDIDSTYARTGANSFRFHADGAYLLANLTSNAAKYARFGLLALGVPPATARICAWLEDGTEHVSLWLTDGLELQMRQGSTVIQTSPTTLELGIWYCIEARVVVHTTTGRFQVRIDGVDDMSAIGICTDADVDGAINQIQFEPPGEDVCIDDIMVREDGWCGTGGVYVVVPTMDGTVKDWASGDYTAIAETPPTFDEYIEDGAGGGHTQLARHSGVGDLDVNVVGVFALGRTDASADVTFQAAARSILTDNVGYAQDLDTIGVYARLLMTTDPNGTVAWTVYAVNNALQLGVKS